eukprot:CAMPEP_0119331518 /NCGR_PEP_ID=MMETSP1333-20130426/80723_1 /TAXON_ID=418940 /ORGANISM="Scyphosphaera apsteinii, Strain RCC1455" /LENGTH=220 /DNA_ID=CAMNT_0007341135 /DNA_START=202 /DNA_END=861 /DNA_ORIENTATION=-
MHASGEDDKAHLEAACCKLMRRLGAIFASAALPATLSDEQKLKVYNERYGMSAELCGFAVKLCGWRDTAVTAGGSIPTYAQLLGLIGQISPLLDSLEDGDESQFSNAIVDSAAVVVFNRQHQALILQRGKTAPWMPSFWCLPGGTIGVGETAEAAAVREARDETALSLRELVRLCDLEYGSARDQQPRLCAFFVANLHEGSVSLLPDPHLGFPEHDTFEW